MEDRGPDSTNVVEVGDYTFVHNLLSISGEFTPQPFVNEERQVVVVYNGEIYNAMEHYTSDGECIIPKYLQYGFTFQTCWMVSLLSVLLIMQESNVFSYRQMSLPPNHCGGAIKDGEIGVATFESALLALGFKDIKKMPANTRMLLDMDSLEILKIKEQCLSLKLEANKTTFDDWNAAFAEAIRKRTKNCREKDLYWTL